MADPVRDFLANGKEWAIANGDFLTVAGAAAVPQGIDIRLGLFRGEAYLDESKGVPYLDDDTTGEQGILGKFVDPLFVRGVLGENIAETPDVTNVVGAELQTNDREALISYAVDTVYSEQTQAATVDVP